MLSKVIGSDDERIVPAEFPHLKGYEYETAGGRVSAGGEDPADSASHAEISDLSSRLRNLEARIAAEREAAFNEGRSQGEQQARAELKPVVDRLNSSIAQVMGMRTDLRRRAERDVVQLALLIARRIINRQLSVDEGALTAIAQVAFERLTRSESYTVTVHPQFAAAVKAAVPANQASRVRIEPDPGCAPGTLIVHSAEGTIDASVDAQLEEISRGLTDRLAGTN